MRILMMNQAPRRKGKHPAYDVAGIEKLLNSYASPGTWIAAADETVRIPMSGRADSLNVAVAAGIVLFEAARQRATETEAVPD